jgi:cytochrome c-type biogenesis protein CcmH
MLWLVFAVLALLVIGILAYPFMRKSGEAPAPRIDFDVVVYRDQLGELEQDLDGGVLTEDQAAGARIEIHRRILAAEDAGPKEATPSPQKGARSALVAVALIAVIVPVGAASMYAALGSPSLPGQSYAWRQGRDANIAAVTSADALEKLLKVDPSAAGYQRLANMYFAAGQYDKAVAADHRAIDLGANDAGIWSEFGESIVMANNGQVLPQALVAFTNALSLSPKDARARFYIGLAETQIGDFRKAVAIWRELEQDSAPEAKWLPLVQQHVAAFAKQGGFDPSSIAPEPPSPAALRSSIAAMTGAMQQRSLAGGEGAPAADTSPAAAGSQDAMIRGMVERLATRMKSTPNDADGWRRLAHAYVVLGEPEKAKEAIAHAVRLKPNDIDVQLTLAETDKAVGFSKKR